MSKRRNLVSAFKARVALEGERRVGRMHPCLAQGILELDYNITQRGMHAIALGRKNYLFVGSEAAGRTAAVADTLIETAKVNDVDPQASSPTRWHGPQTTRSPSSTSCSLGAGAGSGQTGRLPPLSMG